MKAAFIGLETWGLVWPKQSQKKWTRKTCSGQIVLPQKVQEFISQYGGTNLILNVFQEAEVPLGVKPYQICPLLEGYKGILSQRSNLLLVSMAAGLKLEKMADVDPERPCGSHLHHAQYACGHWSRCYQMGLLP